jgi:hypothetical protein
LNGRENVFNVFDPHPADIQQNIKYGSVRLNNEINIVNGIETWSEFLDGLAGDYNKRGNRQKAEDKGQSYRRFPFFLVLHEEDYELYNLTTKEVVKPVVEGHDTLRELMSHEQQATDEEILEEFKDVGKQYGETVLVNATTKEEKLIQVAPNRK